MFVNLQLMTTGGRMYRNRQLRKVLLCLWLQAAAFMGAPMRPDEIEDLLRHAQQARIELSIREDRKDSDDPAQPELEDSGNLYIDSVEVSP
jgi:hypothetical protein